MKAKNRAKIKRCKYCGLPKYEGDHFVCKKLSNLLRTMIKFGFDTTKLGTIEAISEFYRIKDIIENFYDKYASSDEALIKYFNYTSGSANFIKLLKSLNIKVLSYSEAVTKYLLSDRANFNKININNSNYHYKSEWHVTWNNKNVYLRSSYETDFANELDECKIDYEVESLRIKYFDTQKEKTRIAIPDFYIPSLNMIVEIKSGWTYDEQNMKDRVKAYKELGYNFKLIKDHVTIYF